MCACGLYALLKCQYGIKFSLYDLILSRKEYRACAVSVLQGITAHTHSLAHRWFSPLQTEIRCQETDSEPELPFQHPTSTAQLS